MADQYTSQLRLIDQIDGENVNIWGGKVDTNMDLLEDAVAGYASIATTGGTDILSTGNGSTDEARLAMLKYTGVLASNHITQIPSVAKWYIVWNATTPTASETFSVKTSGGVAVTLPSGAKELIFCDGTDCYATSVHTLLTALDCADRVVSGGEGKDWSMTVNALGSVSGTLGAGAIDYSLGHVVTMTMTGDTTIANNTISNWPDSGKAGRLQLVITHTTGTLTFGSAFKKAGGTFAISSGSGARDRIGLATETGGATIDVAAAQNFS